MTLQVEELDEVGPERFYPNERVDVERAANEALAWLDQVAEENVGTSVVLGRLRRAGGGRLTLARRAGQFVGVALATEAGAIFVEAEDATAARAVFRRARSTGPGRVTCAKRAEPWLMPLLVEGGPLPRTHTLVAMRCARLTTDGRGRWAEPRDEERLRLYEAAYNVERRTSSRFDWRRMIAERQVAVLDEGGQIVSVALKSGETSKVACIGGMFTFPEHRRRGLGAALTAFLVARRLEERPTVHLVADDDNHPALGLYRSLGFQEIGRCFLGYLT